ncbi:DUF5677 domain-containing protein [uncultured Pontibacter sp.]|uniref:DUF5677 domain-containing protein n=1 Tax=uncultured Pontibacter sp. TaxID=453356 RepID=UPI002612C2DB|nr:DUF5677 domain-containing protein [uncultured Pontibacter sp.]
MKEQLDKIFRDIHPHYQTIIVERLGEDSAFLCVTKAAFAKNYEFNCLCNSLENIQDSFFLMSSLRGICEDLIAIKYINEHIKIDRDKLIRLMTRKRTLEGTIVQKSFLLEQKPHQIFLEFKDAEKQVGELTDEIKAILVKNGLKGDKEFPSVAQMATDAKLIKLYDYLYYATSKTVHFEPGLLLRLGWTENKQSDNFIFSTKNFNRYHADFCSYYAAILFIEFYKSFKKDLQLDKLIKKDIKLIREVLDEQIRMPEIVTFEECNIKPPSIITQLLAKSAHKLGR